MHITRRSVLARIGILVAASEVLPTALPVERGWSSGDVRTVLGENFLRVARGVCK